jgi:superfamily II DNA or RNA helicase
MPHPALPLSSLAEAWLDPDLLTRSVPPTALTAGWRYLRQGRVLTARLTADGRVLEGSTRGTSPLPYRQVIRLHQGSRGKATLDGLCSCPVGYNCKHVAAVMLRFAEELPRHAPPPSVPPLAPTEPAMPVALANWLATLPDPAAPPASAPRDQLLYLFDIADDNLRLGALLITPMVQALRKDGSGGATRRYRLQSSSGAQRYLTAADKAVLRRLEALGFAHVGLAADPEAEDLLRRILATGRARWSKPEGVTLTEGDAQPGEFHWLMGPDGQQRISLRLPPGLHRFALPMPWYVDPGTGRLGPVECGMPAAMVQRLLSAPPVPPHAAARVATELARLAPAMPPPLNPGAAEPLGGPPERRLLLTTVPIATMPWQSRGAETIAWPVARLRFGYGPLECAPSYDATPRTMAIGGRLFSLTRDASAELEAAFRLGDAGLARLSNHVALNQADAARGDFFVPPNSDTDWIEVVTTLLPALRREGWVVTIAADFPVRLAEPDGDIEARLREGSGIDWFELELGVVVDGERLDLMPLLLRLIARGKGVALVEHHDDSEPFLLPLADGRLMTLPMARIRPMLLALAEMFAEGRLDPGGEAPLRFTRQDAAEALALEDASGFAWQGGEALRSLGRQLARADGSIPPVTLPDGFQGALRPYQAEGVAWLQFLGGAGLGGVLADDMGLGKTVQTLAHLTIEQAAGRMERPALLVCPTSLIPNWTREAARFAPGLRVLALHGPTRAQHFERIAQHDLVLTTYPLLARDHAVLTAQSWHVVVLDEAQAIRNPKAETTRQALRLQAGQRICLSGTPLQNHLGELWSLFDFLAPGFLGSEPMFRRQYRTPIEKQGDLPRQAALRRRVKPFLLRRTKEEVVQDLPPKTEILEQVEMGAGQRAIYEGIRLAMHSKVRAAIAARGLARSGIVILEALLKLRQACCDPRLLKLSATQQAKASSAKLDRLLELLGVLLGEGRRVLVFSQFTSMLALIEARLQADAVPYLLLTGSTRDRETPVRRFQDGEVPVFLISLKAGGVGLNLTAADTVIHYDPWWNPAAEDQASDRAHRIGQTRPVFVHRLVTLGSIEEKMEMLKDRKRALVAAVLQAEAGGALRLTEADVEELFGAG